MQVCPWCGATKRWNRHEITALGQESHSRSSLHPRKLLKMTRYRCEAFSVMDHAAGGEMFWNPYELDNIFLLRASGRCPMERLARGASFLHTRNRSSTIRYVLVSLYHSRPALVNGTNHKAHIKSCSSPLVQTRADDPQDHSLLV